MISVKVFESEHARSFWKPKVHIGDFRVERLQVRCSCDDVTHPPKAGLRGCLCSGVSTDIKDDLRAWEYVQQSFHHVGNSLHPWTILYFLAALDAIICGPDHGLLEAKDSVRRDTIMGVKVSNQLLHIAAQLHAAVCAVRLRPPKYGRLLGSLVKRPGHLQ